MGKKKGGKSSGVVSKGERRSCKKNGKWGVSEAQKMLWKQQAWMKGSNPWLTLENPNKNETNRRFIKVKMNDLKGGSYQDLKRRSTSSNR